MSGDATTPGATTTEHPTRRGHRRTGANLIIGLLLVGLMIAAALLSFIWTPHDPLAAMASERLQGPSANHWFGTDRYGRDVFSGILHGARITLVVGLVAVAIALVVGTPLGVIAGMQRGWIDEVIMRLSDMMMAFPALLMAIIFSAVFGASTVTAMIAVGIGTIPGFARVARSGTMQVMGNDYVLAARASGQPGWRIAFRHVAPNIIGMVLVQSSVSFALAVLAEAGLSFLGLGTPPPIPSWGRMLHSAQDMLGVAPLLAVWPGVAIALAVLGFNLLGDGLRDRFDPKLDGGR